MKALVYTGTQQSEIQHLDAPVAGTGESIVDISFCGICGSDMHAWHGHDERRVPPLVLGHEAVGTVRSGPLAGRRVAINPLITCLDCPTCRAGDIHLCSRRELIGMRYPGAFAEQLRIPDRNLTVIDDAVSFETAALVEPTAVAVRTIGLARRAGADAGSRTVILGGGAIGLLCAQIMKAWGFAPPQIAETNKLRRGMLESLGLGSTYDPRAEQPGDGAVDLVIDAVGMGATRAAASQMVRPGGAIIHVGLQDSDPGLDTRRITLQEIAFIGAYCYRAEDFTEALALLTSGKVTGAGWTDVRPLDAGAVSFQDIHDGRAAPKIILAMS